MGTVKTKGDLASLRIRDSAERQFTQANKLAMLNKIISDDVYPFLVNIESNLVYAEGTVTTVASTAEYTPSFSHNGFLRDGSWLDGEDWYLKQVNEADKILYDYGTSTQEPEAFYLTEDAKVGYLWIPDAVYTVHHLYWKPVTALTTYATDTLPYRAWDGYFEEMLVLLMMQTLERDTTEQAVMAQIAKNHATNMTYRYGVRQYRQSSDMFSIDGL